jgi:hypothetical protein
MQKGVVYVKFAKMRIFVVFGLLLSLLQPLQIEAISLVEKFYEDFESTAVDGYPASFTHLYDGTGSANQKVVVVQPPNATPDHMTTHAFYLQGANNWASEQLVNLPTPLGTTIQVEAYVAAGSGTWPGRIGLYNKDVGDWGTRISGVSFQNGHIYAIRNSNDSDLIDLGEYVLNYWHHVKLVHFTDSHVYDVYIDGIIKATAIPFSSVAIQSLNLTAGNIGTNEIYFDDVKISYNEPVYTVTFDKNGADTEADPTTMTVLQSVGKLSQLPVKPTLHGHLFLDWWTGNGIVGDGIGPDTNRGWGSMITTNTVFTADTTVYAAFAPRYNDGFQNYALDSYPTASRFYNLYNGAGDSYQKIISTFDVDGNVTYAFQLVGENMWASIQVLPLKLNNEQFVTTRMMVKAVSGLTPALFGLYNPTDGMWGTWSSIIEFTNNSVGNYMYAYDYSIGSTAVRPFDEGQWYHIMMKHDLWNRTYDVFVDGVLFKSGLNMHPMSDPTSFAIGAGSSGGNAALYDDVGVSGQNIYKIKFHGNGADYMLDDQYTDVLTRRVVKIPPHAQLDNHLFEGWWTGNGVVGDSIGEDANNGWGTQINDMTQFSSDTIVYARFAINTHTVTIVRFEGDSEVINVNHGENYNLVPLTDDDYIFNGYWYKGNLIEATGYITVDENITLTASWVSDQLIDEDYGLKFEGTFDFGMRVIVRKLEIGDPGFDEIKAKLDAKGENLTMYALYRVTFEIEGEGAEPAEISKILIPFDTAWEDLDILKVFYVSDDMLSDTFLNSFLEDDGYIHVTVNSTSYFALAGSPQEELPDTSDPGSMGGWIGLLGLVLLVFSKKKE